MTLKKKPEYVMTIAVTFDARNLVALTKLKGPDNLIGKFNFNGGRKDPTDRSAQFAAKRESLEEANFDAPIEAFELVASSASEHASLDVFLAFGDTSRVRTMEQEPIYVMDFDSAHAAARGLESGRFSPDFAELLDIVLPRVMAQRAHWDAAADTRPSVSPSLLREFSQSLDLSRPSRLLDQDAWGLQTLDYPSRRSQLRYLYTDTFEPVLVPNVPHNQTRSMVASNMRYHAQGTAEAARQLRAHPAGLSAAAAENIVSRMEAGVPRMLELADQVESGAMVLPDASWATLSPEALQEQLAPQERSTTRRRPR
jgi:8-oxo-dGTP pyrophosphatase MutT (NUDIX family)